MKNKTRMFVYGTLISQQTRDSFELEPTGMKEAILHNYRKEGLNVISAQGQSVTGLSFFVNDVDLAKLDRYEGIPNLYSRLLMTVTVGGKSVVANVYQLNKRYNGNKVVGI